MTGEEWRSTERRPLGVRDEIMAGLALTYSCPDAMKGARKGTLFGDADEDTEKFGPLKVVLQAIPAVFADRQVRLQPPVRNSPVTNTLSGGCHGGEQDKHYPLGCSCVGRTFQFAPK
jgi:hypothetical protein